MALYVTEYVLDFFNKRTDNQPFIQKYATTVFKLINTFVFSLLLINFLFNCKNIEKVYIYYFNILFTVDIINCSISNSYLFKHNLIYLCVIVVFSFILYSFENYFCLISVVPLIVNVISILNLIKDESDSKTNKMSIISSLMCSISILIVMFTFLSPTEFSFNICVKEKYLLRYFIELLMKNL
ncbi:hypothetical protein A0H76_811 [Hepatospora eriocheir]|uniref:Uncharacterized protein n=1 Tax=Hepatospora eriocheir TaxID=1081669 RepID=A0A1X0Q6P0_9MICR|nr:hypothetical protein A0H76_811 [Hepatospora eriocheir]